MMENLKTVTKGTSPQLILTILESAELFYNVTLNNII